MWKLKENKVREEYAYLIRQAAAGHRNSCTHSNECLEFVKELMTTEAENVRGWTRVNKDRNRRGGEMKKWQLL